MLPQYIVSKNKTNFTPKLTLFVQRKTSHLFSKHWPTKRLLKANCSEFTLILICFQILQSMRNRKPDIKIRFQYQENALNPSYIRNTSDWRLKYDVIGLFCLSH